MVTCDDLDDPGHGAVSYTATVYDSVASYSCDVGYSLNGDDERRVENGLGLHHLAQAYYDQSSS